MTEQLSRDGVYYWRVMAFDNNQYGPPCDVQTCETIPTLSDVSCVINVGTYKTSHFFAALNIIPHTQIYGSVNVTQDSGYDLSAKVNVMFYGDIDLEARLTIFSHSDVSCAVNIIAYSNLSAVVRVMDVPWYNNLNARITVGLPGENELFCRVSVKYLGWMDISGVVFVIANGSSDVFARVETFIPSVNLDATVLVSLPGSDVLRAMVNVLYNYPGAVTLFSNVANGSWQTNNSIAFTWLPVVPGDNPVLAYRYKLDKTSSTNFNGTFLSTSGLSANFDLEDYDGAGSYWFHICAVDSFGRTGPMTHFNVLYNHVPDAPREPMTINGHDSVTFIPIIASNTAQTFAWEAAVDLDPFDVQAYHLQIAADLSFDNLLKEQYGIPSTSYDLNLANKLPPGYYYWRVRSFDGHEFGPFGNVGQFQVNIAPSIPTELQVIGL